MTNLIIHGYYYRGKSSRKIIKDLVTVDNLAEAQTKIDEAIAEHDNYIITRNIPNEGDNFTSVDNLSLHHAADHLKYANIQPNQKEATINALDE